MNFEEITYTKDEGIATITLNRPHALNAFTPKMIDEWVTAIEAAKHDDDVRVLVVTGNGRGFCTGIDLNVIVAAEGVSHAERLLPVWQAVPRIPRALADFGKLYMASVNGPAIGAGCDAASMADIRIASDRAKFSINHMRVGAFSADGGYYFLTRLLGVAKTLELAVTFEIFGAEEALRIGLVNRVVPHDELPKATRELALKLRNLPPIALRHAKRLIYEAPNVSLEHHLVDAHQAAVAISQTEDFHNGAQAILEKRVPEFKGR